MVVPEPDGGAHEGPQLPVAGGRVGGVCGTRRGLVTAGHPDLVAVVDAWRAGQRQLREHREPNGRDVVAADRADAGGVVAAQQVQLDRDDVGVVGAELVLDAVRKPVPSSWRMPARTSMWASMADWSRWSPAANDRIANASW